MMTIKDLAAKTGYAVGTVSRALNNHPNVSEKARKAILKAAAESGFQLNENARQLKQHHSNNILVIVKGIGDNFFAAMVETIQTMVEQSPYQIVVSYADESENEVLRAVRLAVERKPLGILFLGGVQAHFLADFDKIHVPAVLVTNDGSHLPFPNLSSVCTDDKEMGRRVIETFVGLGHEKIAIIGSDRKKSDVSRLRYEGSLRAFEEHGIPFDPETGYRGTRFSCEEGYRATRELLQSKVPFTALFAVTDIMAIGAIRALWEAGLRVPEDVSVMGVDGLTMGMYLIPQLSTISQSVHQIAKRSVEILFDAIEGEKAPRYEKIPFEVHIRDSVRSIRK